ncbi:[NiFe] hydrogenase metallocenter assembly protein HypE [hydrothermal vent metagenome]|uniref:[NiFe] hydrogenase metallocenter assembly protein HypE n=1 Tax=hydrothermal vent metagenome TaxID=652676 RepID=A0A3B1CBM5_9ZZZZ
MPRADYITLAHGGGGRASEELIEEVFIPAFSNMILDTMSDGAIIDAPKSGKLAFSTDTFVIDPIFFPGGDIGSLAVHGTVNDIAVSGGIPKYMSAGFVLEEGFPISDLKKIAKSMGEAAKSCGVSIVTGDTKVVARGGADKVFINTSAIGFAPEGVRLSPKRVKEGDLIIASGTIGDHGIAILTLRKGLEFKTEIVSDSQPLNRLVEAMLEAEPDIRMMRDPTRGGLSATLNEIAKASGKGIVIDEKALPIKQSVSAVCEILGLDPLNVANEGKLVAFAPQKSADKILEAMRDHPAGRQAAIIGRVGGAGPGRVEMKTAFAGNRIVEPLVGDQLPRIC